MTSDIMTWLERQDRNEAKQIYINHFSPEADNFGAYFICARREQKISKFFDHFTVDTAIELENNRVTKIQMSSPWHVSLLLEYLSYWARHTPKGSISSTEQINEIAKMITIEGKYVVPPTNHLLFRGQNHSEWGLKTTLMRSKNKKRDQEELILFCNLLEEKYPIVPASILEDRKNLRGCDVAAARHYGVANSFLDFTFNPRVALYFASKQDEQSNFSKVFSLPVKILEEDDLKAFIAHPMANRAFKQAGVFIEVPDEQKSNELEKKCVSLVLPKDDAFRNYFDKFHDLIESSTPFDQEFLDLRFQSMHPPRKFSAKPYWRESPHLIYPTSLSSANKFMHRIDDFLSWFSTKPHLGTLQNSHAIDKTTIDYLIKNSSSNPGVFFLYIVVLSTMSDFFDRNNGLLPKKAKKLWKDTKRSFSVKYFSIMEGFEDAKLKFCRKNDFADCISNLEKDFSWNL